MATFDEMKANIADYLSRSDLDSAIEKGIKRAIKFYEREEFSFMENTGSFVTVTGTQSYTISATVGYASIEQVMINYNNARFEAVRENYDILNALDATLLGSMPTRWAEFGGEVVFYPIPNGSYTVSYQFFPKMAELTTGTDTNVLMENAEDLIEAHAAWWVASRKMRNFVLAAQFKQDEMEALRQVRRESGGKLASGHITPTQF